MRHARCERRDESRGEQAGTGAAAWVASNFLNMLAPIGANEGFGLWAAVSVLTTGVTNMMSNGAAVAVLGPVVLKMAAVANESPIVIGFITAISSAFAYFLIVQQENTSHRGLCLGRNQLGPCADRSPSFFPAGFWTCTRKF